MKFRPALADLNWRRLTQVRRGLLHALQPSTDRPLVLESIRIRHRADEHALAWLLAGWLSTMAARESGGPAESPGSGPASTEALPVTVDGDLDPRADILTVSLGNGLHLRLTESRVVVDPAAGSAPFTLSIPYETEAEAVASELQHLTPDVTLDAVLRTLVQQFGAA
jgi:hypothetical protein